MSCHLSCNERLFKSHFSIFKNMFEKITFKVNPTGSERPKTAKENYSRNMSFDLLHLLLFVCLFYTIF
jgi:hypothetical protein